MRKQGAQEVKNFKKKKKKLRTCPGDTTSLSHDSQPGYETGKPILFPHLTPKSGSSQQYQTHPKVVQDVKVVHELPVSSVSWPLCAVDHRPPGQTGMDWKDLILDCKPLDTVVTVLSYGLLFIFIHLQKNQVWHLLVHKWKICTQIWEMNYPRPLGASGTPQVQCQLNNTAILMTPPQSS